jgi:signal transduction histidine kinase
MMLYVMETSISEGADGTAADGIRMSRRLQQAASLLALSVAKGYTQAMNGALRGRFRRLRHDLRNPLGTIKSVLAMMDDETMPAEARSHPRFRAMAKRNARSLGELIADRLSDAEAVFPAFVQQSASLRTIACGVRRDLRAEAAARATTVTVTRSAPARVMVDAIGLELVLHELLHAALLEASAGDELTIEFGDLRDDRAAMALHCAPARQPVSTPKMLEHLTMLAAQMQAEVEIGEQTITLLMPVGRSKPTTPVMEMPSPVPMTTGADAGPPAGPLSESREPGYDIGGAREREHGQSRTL